MKTLLTFFVLFFSSSVVAGDNLGGKKIFCSEKRHSGIVLIGFKFVSSHDVTIFKETTSSPLEINTHKYKTSAHQIEINDYYNSDRRLHLISRKTLSVDSTKWTSMLWVFKGGTCKVINEDIVDLFNQHLKEYKKDNKI